MAFEEALKIYPDFIDPKQNLEGSQLSRDVINLKNNSVVILEVG